MPATSARNSASEYAIDSTTDIGWVQNERRSAPSPTRSVVQAGAEQVAAATAATAPASHATVSAAVPELEAGAPCTARISIG